MSDHPREAARNLRRIRICDDIYFDMFHWLAPTKVGLALALVSHRFDALVDTHLRNRKWTLGHLRIVNSANCYTAMQILKVNTDGTVKRLPIPQTPLPNCVIGFRRITFSTRHRAAICSADGIAFLQRIGRLLESDLFLLLDAVQEIDLEKILTSVWSLLLNVSVRVSIGQLGLHYRFEPADNDRVYGSFEVGHELYKWLHTPCRRVDGRPKVLTFRFGEGMEGGSAMEALKTTFLSATTSVNFIIVICSVDSAVEPFELANLRTRERLTMRRRWNKYSLIGRSPMGQSAEQWAQWEREALEEGTNVGWKVLAFK